MRVAGIRELRGQLAALLGGDEPIIVTKHGKISGLYLPLDDPDRIPDDLRLEIVQVLGRHLSQCLNIRGVSEAELAEDFREFRRASR